MSSPDSKSASSSECTEKLLWTLRVEMQNQNLFQVLFDLLEVDNVRDYVDIYLFGVKQPQDRYDVNVTDTDIIITFTKDITRLPNEVIASNFEVKGKIAEIV